MGWLVYNNATGALTSPNPVAEKPADAAGYTQVVAVLGYPVLRYWDAPTRGFKDYSAQYLLTHNWNGNAYVAVVTVADARATQKALVATALANAMAAGVTGSKGIVATDEFNRNVLDGRATSVINAVNTVTAPAAFPVMMAAGTYTSHSADEVAVTQQAVVAFIEACKANANTKNAAIDAAASVAEVQAVDPATGWPGVGTTPVIPVKRQRRFAKLVDETRTSTAAFANDGMLVATVEANSTYYIEAFLNVNIANVLAGFKQQFTGPAGATLRSRSQVTNPAGGLSASVLGLLTLQALGSLALGETFVEVRGTLITGANAGTIALQWAQNAANASATTLRAGSNLYIVKLN